MLRETKQQENQKGRNKITAQNSMPDGYVQSVDELHTWTSDQNLKEKHGARFGSTCTKSGIIQGRLAGSLRKDDTHAREAFHVFLKMQFVNYTMFL